MRIKRLLAASFAAALLASGVAGPASAANQVADGLVNVQVGDIQIRDIAILEAVAVVVEACPNVTVNVAAIISAIDQGNAKQTTFCEVEDGVVRVRNN